jgi:hypothetical protein
MNAIPAPGRKFTAYFVVASCHSVSNHVMHTPGLFCRHLSFLQLRTLAVAAAVSGCLSCESLGLSSGFRVIVAHSPVAPHRIEFTFRLIWSLFITDWQFASSCFPRTDFAAAVTFSYRSVDLDLTGTFTPLHQRLRSRTTKPLRGDGFRALWC